MASSSTPSFIAKDTLRRIISDIKELRLNPLTAHGIFYEHDETDMLKGRALIIGPADTPYADGFYLFRFNFPVNYPHVPPTVEFCTGDGYTRFNPNLYRTGKVCLSILNTWKGEPWSGCQTISSVLLAICTVLNAEPLLNEPGITKAHRDYDTYNAIITYKNIEVAMFKMLASVAEPSVPVPSVYATKNDEAKVVCECACLKKNDKEFAIFGDIMREHFLKNKEKIRERVLARQSSAIEYTINVYKMTVLVDYKMLLEKFTENLL
jgi:ubiquitin-protein ligase